MRRVLEGTVCFLSADRNRTLPNLPKPLQTYISECPVGASCHPMLPFNFSSTYTLMSQQFGLNIDYPFSLSVTDTCYRPVLASVALNGTDGLRPFGLNYGPLVYQHATISPYTDIFYVEQAVALGVTLRSWWSLTDLDSGIGIPNSTLVLGGDTTILFYHIGAVLRLQCSEDPIYATKHTPGASNTYSPAFIVSPVVCDTKYQLCINR